MLNRHLVEQVGVDPNQRKGEFVLVVAGCEAVADSALPEALRLARELQPVVGSSQAARIAAAGGRRAILDKGSFGYTPAPGEAVVYG